MKVLSVEFTDTWSWGLVFNEFKKISKSYDLERLFMNRRFAIPDSEDIDVYLIQNATLLNRVKNKIKSVCRLGGNRTFEDREINPIIERMSKCFAIIATNNRLYAIAKETNPNSFLIPNGLNLDEWKPTFKELPKPFVVGFCGNISTTRYREYKGYDYVLEACKNIGLELKTALYKNEQIPHDKMQEMFYSQIDCIVHPTLGEGCSNTLMEAAACGVPIITTHEAGFHGEMMKDGINALFCERSTESIQTNILKLKNNPELKKTISLNSRIFAEEHHDVKKIALQYEQIFRECHDKNKVKIKTVNGERR